MSSSARGSRESRHYESEVVQRWWAIPQGSLLPLSSGGCYLLLFAGRPGTSAGPDVRDAVLSVLAHPPLHTSDGWHNQLEHTRENRRTGDIEFHVRSSDWFAHQHHEDVRYNNVILHVVLICDELYPTVRQDRKIVPTCSLYDLPSMTSLEIRHEMTRPCQQIVPGMSDEERNKLLHRAGLLRFEQKVHAFVEQLHSAAPIDTFDRYDVCLIPALAEALAYGRDRDFFRAVGLHLLGKSSVLPEPLGRSPAPAPLDASRLQVLARLVERWHADGLWRTLHERLKTFKWDGTNSTFKTALSGLRDIFLELDLSQARTDILLCNVVLPFAAAVALCERDVALEQGVEMFYQWHPGLTSNRITRMMCAQLGLPEEPRGSCLQQGLHYIYQQTCREKRCDLCIFKNNRNNFW